MTGGHAINGNSSQDNLRTPPLWAQPLSLIALAFAAEFLIYWPTTAILVKLWSSVEGTYSHGLLLLPISAYLIWRDRAAFAAAWPQPALPALALLAVVCLGWWLAYLIDIRLVQLVALTAMIVAVLWAVLGGQMLRRLAFPLGYLWLGVPIWSPIEGLLQAITVAVVSKALPLVGVPIFVEGDFITIPSGRFHVEEACAGLRFVLAAVAITSLYAHLGSFGWKRGLQFVLISIAMAVVTNWVRVFAVVLLGHVTEMQHPWVDDHLTMGWWMFAAILLPLFWIGHRMSPPIDDAPPAPLASGKPDPTRIAATAAIAGLILVLTPLSAHWIKPDVADTQVVLNTPAADGWQPQQPRAVWQPVFNGADQELRLAFTDAGREGAAYLAYYAQQGQGKELINELNTLYDKRNWMPVSEQTHRVEVAGRPGLDVREVAVRTPGGQTWLIWYWYHVADRATASARTAKLLQVWDLLGPRQGAAVAAVAANYERSAEDARVLLSDLVNGLNVDFANGPGQFIRK